MKLETLKTPGLVLDITKVKRNAAEMSRRIRQFGADLRPHIKTHKCIEVARIQTAGHSGAVTVSTLAEARAFATNGFSKITYAIPIEPGKFAEAIEISRDCELSLITDDVEVPDQLNDAAKQANVHLNLFLKVDCGYHRCGVEPNNPLAIEIPRRISSASNLRFAGILTHAGHSYNCQTKAEVLALAKHERDVMAGFAEGLRKEVGPVPIVSIGSTPTITSVDHLDGIDEVRPGNYIFFDAFQATLGSCSFGDCALTVLASVVHRDRARRKVIIDAGAIALSKDRGPVGLNPNCGYGRVLDLNGEDLNLTVSEMSQEHGVIIANDENDENDENTLDQLSVGSRVRVLANHSCLTAAQHSHYNVLEGEHVVDRWKIHNGW
ncbi:MAG TPA: alanine racemase [Pyrinomonadaceae bacterium]|nr:alanine racemase [Pyrinomonadaceae bacterium]